jgi:DNA-binding MurR/RpiR family transcriptional regulator
MPKAAEVTRTLDVARRIHAAQLTDVEQKIADVILDGYPQSALLSARLIAATAKVSQASVTRFSIKLGFADFWKMQNALKVEMRARLNSPPTRLAVDSRRRKQTTNEIWSRVVELDSENLSRTKQLVDVAELEKFIQSLARGNGAVYIVGSKKASVVARYFAVQLNQVRGRVSLVTLADDLADQLLDLTPSDTLVVFEPRRATKALVHLVDQAHSNGSSVALFSDEKPARALAAAADFVFRTAIDAVSMFDSYAGLFALCHALMAGVVQEVGSRVRTRTERLEELNRGFGVWSDTATPAADRVHADGQGQLAPERDRRLKRRGRRSGQG